MQEIIGHAKQSLAMSKERFLKTLSFVPDDKLTWAPSATSKSALRLAAHVGLSNQGMASMLRGEKCPANSLPELFAMIDEAEKKIISRDQAVKLIEESTNEAMQAMDSMTPERLAGENRVGDFAIPMGMFVMIVAHHMANHASQIDYLQTIWGDRADHF